MRLIRTAILLVLAFSGGVIFARADMRDACLDAGGTVVDSLCRGAPVP